jgi:hypothetical protein
MSGEDSRRTFTLEEANQRLPLVRAIVQDIVDLFRDVSERRDRLATVRAHHGESSGTSLYSEETEQIEEDLRSDEERLRDFINELVELGIEFKDPVKGLVDFPSRVDGRIVYLCWMLGEPEVCFWHELDAGFGERQPILVESIASVDSAEDSFPETKS